MTFNEVLTKTDDLYSEMMRRSILMADLHLYTYFQEMLANMPKPPDPFWGEVTL